jgi:hypothetical protein
MENKLLSYILQMQKQSSTQSVPKLPKAQTGKQTTSKKRGETVLVDGKRMNTYSDEYEKAYNKGIGQWVSYDKASGQWNPLPGNLPNSAYNNAEFVSGVVDLPEVTVSSKLNPNVASARKKAQQQLGSYEDYVKGQQSTVPKWAERMGFNNKEADRKIYDQNYGNLLNTRTYQNLVDAIPQKENESRVNYINRFNNLAGKNAVSLAREANVTEPFDPSNLAKLGQWGWKGINHIGASIEALAGSSPGGIPNFQMMQSAIQRGIDRGNQPTYGMLPDEAKQVGVFQPFETVDDLAYKYGFKPALMAGDNLMDPSRKQSRDFNSKYLGASDEDKIFTSLLNPLNYISGAEILNGGRNLVRGAEGLKGAYNTVAKGESFLPIAWKSPAVGLTQEASADMFKGIANANKLSDADRALLLEYQYDSKPFTGRWGTVDQSKKDALNNLIKNNNLNFTNDAILTRKFNPTNKSLGAEFVDGTLNLGDRPSSFSAGVGMPGYGSGAVDRLVVPNRYSKQMGNSLLANEYNKVSDGTFDLLSGDVKNFAAARGIALDDLLNAEREVIGTGLDFKRIGKVKNDIGGYDHIVRPRNITKSTGTQSVTRGPINYWEEPGFAKRNPNFNPEVYANSPSQKFAIEDIPDNLKPFMEKDLTKDQWKAFNSEQRRLRTNYKLGYDKYENGGYYDCPDQEKDPVTGKCKAEVVRGREAAAANKAANADMNAWAKQVAAIDKANAQQDAAQYAGQLGFDYDWMQSPVDKAEKKAAVAGYKQFFQQNPKTFVPDDTSGFSPEQKYIIASKLKQKASTPMGSKAFQQKFNQDPRFMDLGRIQSDIVPTMGGWPAVRNWMFNNKAYGGPIVDPRGQWAHPGQVTRIPSSNITMQGVPYPVLGVGSNGQRQMMYPGKNYSFGGAEHVDEYPMMANGGYTVTRSDDRQGQTHKVTGPDGTVKYFGDSNLGQHPKDPERKAAFYARHKSNLEGNPFFRAFARETWKEGGQTEDDREMLDGVADILRRVNDVNNRKQLAKYMMNNFREEDVIFEPNQFLKSANAFKEGGEMIRRADGSYSRRGLWDNIRANKGSGKKPTKQMLEQERKINSMQGGGQKPIVKYKTINPDDLPHFSQWNPKPGEKEAMAAAFQKQLEDNDKYRDNDGMLESILEFVDPTGVSSWDDVARSFRNPLGSNWDRAFNLFSAIPIVGKIGKGAKAVSVAGKVATKPGVFKKVGNAALKGIDVLAGGPAMRYFDQTINPISRGFGAISGKAVQQIPYSGVRKVWGVGSDFNQMRRFQDGVISPAFNQLDNFMTQPPNNPNKK